MNSISSIEVDRKATRGVFTLIGRSAFLQIFTLAATFILTILLSPAVFGIFFIVSGIIAFLNYFSDIGLAAALVQKKEEVTQDDLRTTFTLQQLLIAFLVILSLAVSPFVANFYRLDQSGLFLLQALIVAFFLSSLKTIPSILLERELDFYKLVIPQIIETVVFYGTAVCLAYLGWGITSFTVAVLLRGFSGLMVLYFIKPWRPAFGIEPAVVQRLLRYGLPFQLNSILALFKDDLFTVFLGKILTFTEIGYIGWAKKWAEVPLRLIMDNIIRVTFPAYARLQHNAEHLGRAVEKALMYLSFLVIPLALEIIFLIQPFVSFVPKYEKWQPALISFYFFAVSTIFSSLSTPLINALNAIGKINITLKFMIAWTLATWIFIPALVIIWGFQAVSIGMFFIALSFVFVIVVAKRYISFALIPAFLKPVALSSGLLIFLLIMNFFLWVTSPFIKFLILSIGGMLFYLLELGFFAKREIQTFLRIIRHD